MTETYSPRRAQNQTGSVHDLLPQYNAPHKQLDLTPEDPAWVCISSNALHWDLYLMLGEGPLQPADGGGGWEVRGRPRDTGLTLWNGNNPWTLAVPVMVDSWAAETERPDPERRKHPPKFKSLEKKKLRKRARRKWRRYRDRHTPVDVEQFINLVNRLQRPGGDEEPPRVRLYGKAVPHWLNGDQFVLAAVEWGERLVDTVTGETQRQAFTINFLRFTDDDELKVKRRKTHKKDKGTWNRHHYTVKRGDTLQSIAKDQYGDWRKWKKIAEANKITKPRSIEVGDVLKIP
jgi:hypothetical protein